MRKSKIKGAQTTSINASLDTLRTSKPKLFLIHLVEEEKSYISSRDVEEDHGLSFKGKLT